MNWYKKSQITGEWWIIDGRAVFADNTIGDMGHEAYVLDQVRREIADTMGYLVDEFYDWDETKEDIVKNLIQQNEINLQFYIKKYGKEWIQQIPYKPEIFDGIAKNKFKISQEQLDMADGSGDIRVYGMKELGWKRLAGNNIETQTLTQSDLDDILNGIYDAYDEDAENHSFNIEVRGNGKVFWNIPYNIMADGVMAIAEYDRGVTSVPTYALNNGWYKKAQIEEKQPWQMTQDEYFQYHYTGFISSSAYDKYKTKEGLEWLKKSQYPILYDKKQFGSNIIEFRKSGNKLQYVKHDDNEDVLRDENGLAIMMTPQEIIDAKLTAEDQTIVAFIGDDAIGLASNEWGATGIWVVEDYQKLGIGTYLLKEFRKTMNPKSKLGQMTESGIELTKAYHKKLVQEALNENKNVPQEVLDDYPDLTGGTYDINYWIRQIKKNPINYYEMPEEFKYDPKIQEIMTTIYVDMITKYPNSYYSMPIEFKNSKEIQNIVKSSMDE